MCSLHYRRWLSRGTTDPRPRVGEGLRDFTPEELQIADRVYRRRFYLRNIAQGLAPGDDRHGSMTGYNRYGCRCDECCAAQREHYREMKRRRAQS